jgi:hypothetical protein
MPFAPGRTQGATVPVPFEYSIAWLSGAIASILDAVMVGLPRATRPSAILRRPGPNHGDATSRWLRRLYLAGPGPGYLP